MEPESEKSSNFKFTKTIIIVISILSMSLAAAIFGYSCSDNISSIEPILEAEYVNSYEHLKEVWATIDKIYIYKTPHIDSVLYYFDDGFDRYINIFKRDQHGRYIYNNEPYIKKAVDNYISKFRTPSNTTDDMYRFIKSFNTSYIIKGTTVIKPSHEASASNIEYGLKSNRDLDKYLLSPYYQLNKESLNTDMFVAFTDDYINQKQEDWTSSRNSSIKIITLFTILLLISIITLSWLMYVTGLDDESGKVILYKIDYVNTYIMFIAAILLIALWFIIIKAFMPESYINMSTVWFTTFFDFIITVIFSSILLAILLSLARRFKSGILTENSTIYRILNKSKSKKSKHHKFYKALLIRQVIFILLEAVILGLLPLTINYMGINGLLITIFFASSIALIYFISSAKAYKCVDILVEHIDQIYEGNLNYKSEMPKKSLLYDSSKKLENIGEGLQKSVEKQIKGEKLKMDLITNVSHDLKTPLTSIISYIDLLSKEKNMSEEERDYIRILAQKSDSLKNIVSDLFDLAKVTSGNSELKLEKLDMNRLIIQTLGDMEDKIDSSKYIIKTSLPDMPAYILADGKKMYRVFQNIIDNALKYSLSGTRIFIDLKLIDNKVNLSVKNTSSYEMNFTEDEILERFTRGDKSRTTEGNGLGLSIAQNFTQACGGQFKISIDGDQFKVNIYFDVME